MERKQVTDISTKRSSQGTNRNDDQIMLNLLRDILLKKDREDIADLKAHIYDNDRLSEVINPAVAMHMEMLKRKFPNEYQKQVEKIIDRKLKDSQDEILDVVYPVMGKMVRKYVNYQFFVLRENFEQRLRRIFSPKAWVRQFKISVLGIDPTTLTNDEGQNLIEEVYVIERDSGILLGHHAREETIDRDIVAGMLTAIKSFVEDAFQKKNEELEMIDYGRYKIFIQTFQTYYISIVLNGLITTQEKETLVSKVLDFAEGEIAKLARREDMSESDKYKQISSSLKKHF